MSHRSVFETAGSYRRPSRRSVLAATFGVALLLGVTGCGSSGSSGDQGLPKATTTAPTGSSAASSGDTNSDLKGWATAPESNAITITAPGMYFEVKGELHPGVATITFDNPSPEAHMLAIAKVKDGVTLDQFKAAMAKGDADAQALMDGSPEAAYGSAAAIGASWSTTATMTDLPAGHYVIACFFTDDSGKMHAQMGMVGDFTVAGTPATAMPKSDGTIKITDSGIELPTDFTGHGTYVVENAGKKQHGFQLAKLDDGTTLEAYNTHVGTAQNTGKAVDGGGGEIAGGIDALDAGAKAYLSVDLPSGHYGYVSIPDESGPAMPAQHGEFDVE